MTTTDKRTAMITGLRDLATFLEANPELPIPHEVSALCFPARGTDAEMTAEVDRIATLLGTEVDAEDASYSHYRTGINFGPVRYGALAVLAHRRARYDAETSYIGCVEPNSAHAA
ncbi:hypothetical protein [Streptosporangium sp. V21-05]|uniref:hypothetical protein n=1 Tax=Streptosporangium sp. V21-05 TaxID=3446115 RepID=UPI003F531F93